MPSSTALLETDDGEPEVPPPLVHAFAGIGLGDPATLPGQTPEHAADSFPRFGFLGAVLDLKPLSIHPSIEEQNCAAATTDEGSEVAVDPDNGKGDPDVAQARSHRASPGPGGESAVPETILLYNSSEDMDDLQTAGGVVLLPSDMYGGESGYETEQSLLMRRKSVNTTECVAVPSSEHVAEIVGRQGCKIKALRAKTNTYIKTPVRGDQPVFVVTGRKEDVAMAKREILSAAEHFSLIRASRNKTGPLSVVAGPGLPGAPTLPGQTTIQVRVPYRVVGLVVGPKGATIKRIQQQTHTYIVTPSRDKEPVFEVTGMPENVDRAREEIEAHIALRTGTCGGMELPGTDDNDFHFNGTDVSFEGLAAAGLGHAAWLQSAAAVAAAAGGGGSLPAMGVAGTPQVNGSFAGGVKMSSTYRNDSSSSLGSGSSSADSFYGNGNLNRMADFSPTCSANANNNNNNNGGGGAGASFWFGDGVQPLGAEDMAAMGGGVPSSGFDPLTISTAPGANPLAQPPIWSPYVEHQGLEACKTQTSHPGTPRLSPTLLGAEALEHPQAQRVQRASLGAAGAPECHRFAGYGPAFSSSSESTASAASSSPPEPPFPCRRAAAETCIHCLESQVVAALVPCGHNLFCLACATRICRGPDPACPVCFYPATQAIQLRNM